MPTLVEVTWWDANHSEDDIPENKIMNLRPALMHNVGLLLRDDAEMVTVAGNWCQDDDLDRPVYRDVLCIPRAEVIEIRELVEGSNGLPSGDR